jgi:hypothetical protein
VDHLAVPFSTYSIELPIQTLFSSYEQMLSDLSRLDPGTPQQQKEIEAARATAKG